MGLLQRPLIAASEADLFDHSFIVHGIVDLAMVEFSDRLSGGYFRPSKKLVVIASDRPVHVDG